MVYRHLQDVQVSAVFSLDGKHRYWLEMNFPGRGSRVVCAIMQNPSQANEEIADRSVQFLERLVFDEGYPEFRAVGRLIVVNQFSYVQTRGFVGGPCMLTEETDRYIMKAIEEADIVLIAWGRSNPYRDRIAAIKRFIRASNKSKVYRTRVHPSRGSFTDFIERLEGL